MIESKARLLDIAKDWKTGKFRLTFELDTFQPNMADAIRDVCLRLSVKKWKEKRSLDANSYMWALLSQMAAYQGTSSEELYEQYLQWYGLPDADDEGHIVITLRSNIDISRLDGHWRYCKTSNDGKWNFFLRIKGTSEYNSAEMATFLDRIIEDAQAMGIPTETPNQKAEAERWLTKKAR